MNLIRSRYVIFKLDYCTKPLSPENDLIPTSFMEVDVGPPMVRYLA